jgi:hypothetical protein
VALGQPKTDVVTLANGDRITGEIVNLAKGRLELKTDDAGTLEIEWDKIARVEATREFEVNTSDGRLLLGSLGRAGDRVVLVVISGANVTLSMDEVTGILPIGTSFWAKLDGSISAGFNYTRSSGIAQGTLNSDTVFRRPAFLFRLTAAATVTEQKNTDNSRDDRGTIEFSYVRYPWRRMFVAGSLSFETNESLGLVLRSQGVGLVGERLVNTNRAQVQFGGGLAVNDEKAVDAPEAQNLEGVIGISGSYYTYDRPKTTVDASIQYYPSLSNWGRQRLQFDSAVKREIWKDFTVSLNTYDSFDSAPPNPDALRNDFGVTVSVGWTY